MAVLSGTSDRISEGGRVSQGKFHTVRCMVQVSLRLSSAVVPAFYFLSMRTLNRPLLVNRMYINKLLRHSGPKLFMGR